MKKQAFLITLILLFFTGCGVLPFGQNNTSQNQSTTATTDINGLARVSTASSLIDFEVTSGLDGERIAGVQLEVVEVGITRLLWAQESSSLHLPVGVPLPGTQTVRRLVMPPRTSMGYNITTVTGAFNLADLTAAGTFTEADLREHLAKNSPDQAALLYLYNPERPLALTGAALDVYTSPIPGLLVLRPGGEDPALETAMVAVSLNSTAYDSWSHLPVDRYLASRVGRPADLDLRGDLAFRWAFPVFDVFPTDEVIELDAGSSSLTLRINWRSQNPDPPPPWSFFLSADHEEAVLIEPDNFSLQPGDPPEEVTITIDRTLFPEGEQQIVIYIQPFSDAFGLIQQAVERALTFTVEPAPPTPTPGPSIDLTISPTDPHQDGTLTVTATGFNPGETVLVEFVGTGRTISDGLPTADAQGHFTYEIDLHNTPTGDYLLRLTGADSGITGTLTVTVSERPPDAVVNTDELNVRLGPSYEYPVLEVLVKGDALQVIGVNEDDSWLEVITPSGIKGWVVANLVTIYIDLTTVPWNPNVPAMP